MLLWILTFLMKRKKVKKILNKQRKRNLCNGKRKNMEKNGVFYLFVSGVLK